MRCATLIDKIFSPPQSFEKALSVIESSISWNTSKLRNTGYSGTGTMVYGLPFLKNKSLSVLTLYRERKKKQCVFH